MTAVKPSDRFQINSPAVVSEIIDGEAVIMNLKSGHYFSIQGSGARIWDWIGEGHSLDVVIDCTKRSFVADAADVETSVLRFVDDLLQHELIRENDEVDGTADAPPAPRQVNGDSTPFEIPVVEAFNDMQDLLLLDPIHDVDEAGWPRLKDEDEQEAYS
jgi:hypothetical protein